MECEWKDGFHLQDLLALLSDDVSNFTAAWATVPGLRGKYFTYNEETQTVSGIYTFFTREAMQAYTRSELFKEVERSAVTHPTRSKHPFVACSSRQAIPNNCVMVLLSARRTFYYL